VIYLSSKYYFVKYSSPPVFLDEGLILFFQRICQNMAIFHFLNGLLIYSDEDIYTDANKFSWNMFDLSSTGFDKMIGSNYNHLTPYFLIFLIIGVINVVLFLKEIYDSITGKKAK
jgi:hypothetical protein